MNVVPSNNSNDIQVNNQSDNDGDVVSPDTVPTFPAHIPSAVDEEEEEEEDDYEYEDEDDTGFAGFLATEHPHVSTRIINEEKPATIEEEEPEDNKKLLWREPTRAAVNMSLRAEKETSGGKRRLAQDLYRIMNQDTIEAGFSLETANEDAMDKWKIKLFKFDQDSNLAKDMMVLGVEHVELEMKFPEQYPFEPPFVRVVKPRFRRQTGFVMNGALCMELLTKDGWNPINDIESVIVSIRSLLVVGDGRLEAATNLTETKYEALLAAALSKPEADNQDDPALKRLRKNSAGDAIDVAVEQPTVRVQGGAYSLNEAVTAYSHLSDYHKKKGWDTSGWWARKG